MKTTIGYRLKVYSTKDKFLGIKIMNISIRCITRNRALSFLSRLCDFKACSLVINFCSQLLCNIFLSVKCQSMYFLKSYNPTFAQLYYFQFSRTVVVYHLIFISLIAFLQITTFCRMFNRIKHGKLEN